MLKGSEKIKHLPRPDGMWHKQQRAAQQRLQLRTIAGFLMHLQQGGQCPLYFVAS